MKLWFIFLLMLIIFRHSVFGKKANSDQSRVRMLIDQLMTQNGVSKFNLFIDKHKNNEIVTQLQRLLTKSAPILSMKYKSLDWSKYCFKNFYQANRYAGKSRENKILFNFPTQNALLIYVFSSDIFNAPKKFDYAFIDMVCARFTFTANIIPKVLLVTVCNNKTKSYRGTIFSTFECYIQDVDLLEISHSDNSMKRKIIKRRTHDFIAHKYNYFLNRYSRHRVSRNTRWFKQKLNNLHGYKMYTLPNKHIDTVYRYDPIHKKNIRVDLSGPESNKGKYFEEAMNFTFYFHKRYFKVLFPERVLKSLDNKNFLKPCLSFLTYAYTPIIYEIYYQVNVDNLLMCFAALPLIVFLVLICRFLGKFDRRTWSPLTICKMLLAMENPYN